LTGTRPFSASHKARNKTNKQTNKKEVRKEEKTRKKGKKGEEKYNIKAFKFRTFIGCFQVTSGL